jgi:nucleoside-diphosphate-sugar epimerase
MELVIIRPVLVYGPGVRANFRAMLHAVDRGLPLPFGSVQNRRSLVAIDNLVDLLVRALSHPGAAGRTFLVSDGEDLSTPDLLNRAAHAMSKRALLVPMPVTLLEGIGALMGKRSFVRRLCSSLTVDITSTKQVLDWAPPVRVDDALRSTVASYLCER